MIDIPVNLDQIFSSVIDLWSAKETYYRFRADLLCRRECGVWQEIPGRQYASGVVGSGCIRTDLVETTAVQN